MGRFRLVWVALAAVGLGLWGPPARAAGLPVDLELMLAVDVSGSIDRQEAALQRRGYLEALVHPDVVAAIRSGPLGRIAISYVEWAGAHHRRTIADWTVIDGPDSARALVAEIAKAPLTTGLYTSISGAIEYSAASLDLNAYEGIRRIIDVSGDGPNNSGNPVVPARDKAVGYGITINGLAIINDRPSRSGWPPFANLDLYYQDCVIGGVGAFLLVSNFTEDFIEAVRRKLILEIAGYRGPRHGGGPRVWAVAARERPDCLAGERRLQEMMEEY